MTKHPNLVFLVLLFQVTVFGTAAGMSLFYLLENQWLHAVLMIASAFSIWFGLYGWNQFFKADIVRMGEAVKCAGYSQDWPYLS